MQTTVRGIPSDLEHHLRERARASGESLNRTLIRLLREAVGMNPTRKKRDLSALVGTWSQEEADEFDREVRGCGGPPPGPLPHDRRGVARS